MFHSKGANPSTTFSVHLRPFLNLSFSLHFQRSRRRRFYFFAALQFRMSRFMSSQQLILKLKATFMIVVFHANQVSSFLSFFFFGRRNGNFSFSGTNKCFHWRNLMGIFRTFAFCPWTRNASKGRDKKKSFFKFLMKWRQLYLRLIKTFWGFFVEDN